MILAIMNLFTSNRLVPLFNLLIFVLLLSRSESGRIRCMEKERQALLLFKEGIEDDSGFLSSWRTGDCCEWQGVRCSNRTSRVIALDLSYAWSSVQQLPWLTDGYIGPLRGKVGPSLLELQDLTYLDLSFFNGFGSTIPKFIGSLSKLKYLNLTECTFDGIIPDQLGNLSNLQTLDLKWASSVRVRNLEWLSHLSSLRYLDLSFVDLSGNIHTGIEVSRFLGLLNSSSLTSIILGETGLFGSVPQDLGKMKSLEHLDLSMNDLEGGITNSIGNLSSLRSLVLYNNRLNGTIPSNLWKLPKLEVLDLSSNQLLGSLPDFKIVGSLRLLLISSNELNGKIPESINSLSELEVLDFSHNRFEGIVSTVHLLNHTKLRSLQLSDNSLVLKFSTDWVPPFNLSEIRLRNCKLGPHFPSWLRNQNHLEEIDISGSGIHDAIPKWFWDLSSQLVRLDLSNNYIYGILPDLSLKFGNCNYFYLSSNNIEGPIPKLPVNITHLHLSKNRFQGSIPKLPVNIRALYLSNNSFRGSLSALCDYSSLIYIDLSDNLLSGRIPDCLMQFKPFYHLNLGNNKLSGSIPSSIGLLTEIRVLVLRNTSLEGELPTSLQQCGKLGVLDIAHNKFTGKIPVWLGRSLSSLIILSLHSNQFTSKIPSSICYLKMIKILDFSVNNISGMIPNCISNFTLMASKQTAFVAEEEVSLVWKGTELEYYGSILELVKTIDLSSNNLTGEIPPEITYLECLVALNISGNNLHGKIPPEIGHLQLLESLDLSRNQLSGMIPSSLSQLNFIGVMNLSNNNLSGKIPSSTQLQSFDAAAYTGNSGLCGLPLPNLCPEDEGNLVRGRSQEDEKFINPGFYAALGIGFAVGLWGTLGSLLFNTSWRVVYFRLVANIQDSLYVTIIVNMVKVKRLMKK